MSSMTSSAKSNEPRVRNDGMFNAQHYVRVGEIVPIWKTTVTSTGKSSDIRRVFPVLVTAGDPYWGKNTGQQVGVWLREYDPRVSRMKARLR